MSAFVLIGNKIAKAECGNSTYIFSALICSSTYIYIYTLLCLYAHVLMYVQKIAERC